jgi:hypothetical protein
MNNVEEKYIPEAIRKQIEFCDAMDRVEHSCALCHEPVSRKSIEDHGGHCHHCGAEIEIVMPFFGNDFCALTKPYTLKEVSAN